MMIKSPDKLTSYVINNSVLCGGLLHLNLAIFEQKYLTR